MLTRREFVKTVSCAACTLCVPSLVEAATYKGGAAGHPGQQPLREVMFYKKIEGHRIECEICPRKCRIADLERGYCGNKENRSGSYYSLVHSYPCAVHIDPIEKKPLFHYLPSTTAFSVAAAGCNFECRFCQNWRIAQYRPEQVEGIVLPPEKLVQQAIEKNSATIAYTYTEPVVYYEYMFDCAREGRRYGLGSVMISNGFINETPLRQLCVYLTAVKIDLKAFTQSFYHDYCSGELEPVLNTLRVLKSIGIWFELVVLVIPTLNDSPEEIRRMSAWIADTLGCDVPLHFSRFHPMYKIKNLPPTPISTLEACHKTAIAQGLHYVYLGNVPGHPAENTYCHKCGKIIIKRIGYSIVSVHLADGTCAFCGQAIPGVWKAPGPLAV